MVEALAPYTLAPAWDSLGAVSRSSTAIAIVWFDSLNRYYVAEEAGELARLLRGRAGLLRRGVPVPQGRARAWPTRRIPTIGWPR